MDETPRAPALLQDDPFYAVLAAHPDVCVDYCLIRLGAPYRGIASHKAALGFALQCLSADSEDDGPVWSCEIGKAVGRPIAAAALLAPPEAPWKRTELIFRSFFLWYGPGRA